jgi:hypothetical protein
LPYLKHITNKYTDEFTVEKIGWRRYFWEKWLDCSIYGRYNYASRKEPVNPADEWIPTPTYIDGYSVQSWSDDVVWYNRRRDVERWQAEYMEEPI